MCDFVPRVNCEAVSGPHTTQTMAAAARASMVLLLFALAVLNAASTGTRYVQNYVPIFCLCSAVIRTRNIQPAGWRL